VGRLPPSNQLEKGIMSELFYFPLAASDLFHCLDNGLLVADDVFARSDEPTPISNVPVKFVDPKHPFLILFNPVPEPVIQMAERGPEPLARIGVKASALVSFEELCQLLFSHVTKSIAGYSGSAMSSRPIRGRSGGVP
jgi:hypothetical protein